ncbi:nesprin-3 [Antennarius striatus]|uniref:nesprin-3 n=1 Tax=Antennarius striatus TaxID=241820 RepID=UPI0035B09D3D
MTQQEQQEFMESLEVALSWMHAIQERLRANDNTQGPRDALEARLRETEKIHQSQHEGRVKMDMALVAAQNLLQGDDEELKNHTHTKLKDLKSLWEETVTYIIHCHSRIEWVWLHWGEYLKAYEEFELWLTRQHRSLDVRVEHQLGVKEKLWQVDQQRVVVSDIHSQATLLERLLDEAAALHNRTHDPSVAPQAQERLQEAYNNVRDGAEERLLLLQEIAREHQAYQGCVQRFQSWLLSKTKELTDLMEREDTAENKLKALQALDDIVAGEENTLQHIEGVAEAVRENTSPAGAEVVVDEAEELRLGWQRLRQGLCEAEDGLRSSLDSYSQYTARCQRLGEDIRRLRALMQNLDRELEASCQTDANCTENQMVDQWRRYMVMKNTLAGEESQVELLKAQLKELFRFSEDSRHLSDDVLAVVKEHQSVKYRVAKLCSESETGLKLLLQDPLLLYAQWSHAVSQVLEASAEVNDFSNCAMLLQNIEHLLKDSVHLQERFRQLQVKGDLLSSVFGPERCDSLQDELSAAVGNRELLHTLLLQRKNRLQGFISRTKDFEDAHELILSKMIVLQDRLSAADHLQPDILAKKSQLDQLRVIQRDLEVCEAQILALETLVCSSQSNRNQFERLYIDWKQLHKTVTLKVKASDESIAEHESFHETLLNLEKWMMIMKQKLESFHIPSGEWSIEGRQHEAERALGEFPENELQLQQLEVHGQEVLEKTSAEGKVYILRDLKSIQESWFLLCNMSLNLQRLLKSTEQTDTPLWRVGGPHGDDTAETEEGSPTGAEHQQNSAAVRSGASFSSGRGRGGGGGGLEAQEEEEVTDQGGRLQSRGAEHPSRAGEGSRLSLQGDGSTHRGLQQGSSGRYTSRRKEFEAWLSKQNDVLSGILTAGVTPDAKELKVQLNRLKALRAGVSWGQEQFQLLLQDSGDSEASSGPAEDVCLEELRYRWMLYKSKLKDVGDVRARSSVKRVQAKEEEPGVAVTVQKKPGLLQRVCRLALPLWLLLLALLLLAFLLPLMDGGSSCSLSNNFARSFSVMLRYDGPPPT